MVGTLSVQKFKSRFPGTCFEKLCHSILESAALYKDIKIKHHSEPWITSEIVDNIRKRDTYLLSYKISGSKSFICRLL